MAKISILELHHDGDIQIGPKRLRGDEDDPEVDLSDEPAVFEEDRSSWKALLALVIPLGLLVAAGLVVRKFRAEADGELGESIPVVDSDDF